MIYERSSEVGPGRVEVGLRVPGRGGSTSAKSAIIAAGVASSAWPASSSRCRDSLVVLGDPHRPGVHAGVLVHDLEAAFHELARAYRRIGTVEMWERRTAAA